MIAPHDPHRKCPMCGRVVARWTNGGTIPPHGKRTVRHKCPHGTWCQQANPLVGTHSNGRPVMHYDARTGKDLRVQGVSRDLASDPDRRTVHEPPW